MKEIAIIGDRFMLPEIFREKIEAACPGPLHVRTLETAWPDEPMEHGYAVAGLEGLKEYFGDPDEVVNFIGEAEVFVTQLAPLSAGMFARLPNLKLVAVSRGGPVNIDMAAARRHGVTVVNTPGRNASAVAEFTLGAILAETRLIRLGHESMRAGEWRGDLYRADRTGRELSEMTVGVVGYGAIGTKVVRLLRAFGCKVLVADPYVQLSADDHHAGVELVGLDELLSRSDLVTLHPRVTAETQGMINRDTLRQMKPGAILVNTARGPLVDYDALAEALETGLLSSAMLDTYAVEPVPADWPLLKLPNVTLTPHIAGASVRTVTFAAEQAAEEVRRFLAGLPPLNPLLRTASMDGETPLVDLFVIGGGVNGAGITRDAAGRGLSVVLCEKDDLAQGTSSRSGKLVHGGLRYLEYYEFRLVREALIEREVLLESAPHIIWPMRFVLPHSPDDRPAWLVRLGLFLYDHLGGRKRLPPTRVLDLRRAPEGAPIKERYAKGFEYSDCWVDDARLVVLNALDAHERGAAVLTRHACVSARREDGLWTVRTRDVASGQTRTFRARALINAAGPWVNDIVGRVAGLNAVRKVRLVKGSHIVTPKFWEGPHSYLVQNTDRRVIFINPYEGDKALIGTTDIPFDGRPEEAAADESEIAYLLGAVNRYFRRPLGRDDVLQSFSGVRPLYDDNADNPSAVTRDYVFELDAPEGQPPMLSVFGGKITTFRKLGEHALEKLKPFFPATGGPWTAGARLPGGDMPDADFERFLAELQGAHPWLPPDLARHYARLYGTRALKLLDGASGLGDLGRKFGPLFFEREALYLFEHEWASTAEDVLERRTKHGLHMSADERAAFAAWSGGRLAQAS